MRPEDSKGHLVKGPLAYSVSLRKGSYRRSFPSLLPGPSFTPRAP